MNPFDPRARCLWQNRAGIWQDRPRGRPVLMYCNRVMNTKTLLMTVAVAALGTIFASNRSHGALTVSNGDFSNLSGLTNHGGGWYGGVPTGWSTQVAGPSYTFKNGVANLQTLGPASPFHPLYQDLGTTDSLSTITLSFDLSNLQPPGTLNVGVGIYNTNGASPGWSQALTFSTYTATGSHTLVASNVPANTPITVAFWNSAGGFAAAGLDNVSVIPEPRAALLGGIGLLVLLMRRRGIR